MSKIVSNYTANGSSTTDEYGTFVVLNRFLQGDVVEGFAVVANGTPNLTVLVQPGSGRITTGTYPSSYGYLISHDTSAGESVTISTPAASPRIDYIVAYIDKAVAGSTSGANVNNTNNVLKFAAVAGTPAGSPSVPTVSQIQTTIGAANPYIILAQIAVGANVTQITSASLTDKRNFITSKNGLALGSNSYVDNGLVWTAGSGLAASMSAGTGYMNVSGAMVPVTMSAISSRTFTASKDTYIALDVLGNITYNETTNGGTIPALPSSAIWLAVVVTGSSTIGAIRLIAMQSLIGGQRFAFRYYRGTAQNIGAAGAFIKIGIDTKSYDYGNNFNVATNEWIVPAKGIYHINGRVSNDVQNITSLMAAIFVNGSVATRGDWSPSGNYRGVTVSDDLLLNQGDKVTLYAFSDGAAANMIAGTDNTYISGHLAAVAP